MADALTQTFRAICPDTKIQHVFRLVSDGGKTIGWCTKCLKSFPLTELSDGKTGDDDMVRDRRGKKKKKTV